MRASVQVKADIVIKTPNDEAPRYSYPRPAVALEPAISRFFSAGGSI
jgi:hypothetical protein